MDMILNVQWLGWLIVGCRNSHLRLHKFGCNPWVAVSRLFHAMPQVTCAAMAEADIITIITMVPVVARQDMSMDDLLKVAIGSADTLSLENVLEPTAASGKQNDSPRITFC